MKRVWILLALLACTHETKSAGQSFTEAMQIICDAPAQADPTYWKAHLKNVEAITLFEAIGDLSPEARKAKITAALAKANLQTCRRFDAAPARIPVVATAPGAIDHDATSPVVTISSKSLTIDGKKILDVVDRVPTDSEVAGEQLPRVRAYLASLVSTLAQPLPRVELALDPDGTYGVLVAVIDAAKRAGFTNFGVAVSVNGKRVVIPFELPRAKRSNESIGATLSMTVSVKPDEFDVWSLTGAEGTIQKPIAAAQQPATIATALGEVVARHYPAGTPRTDRSIVIVADAATVVQRIADAMAAVRQTADGHDLFPEIQLAITR